MEGEARTGPVKERMVGPRHPLQSSPRTRIIDGWRAASAALRRVQALDIDAARFRIRTTLAAEARRDEALVRQGFAHRFLVAMQETCILRRRAAIRQLQAEQEAVVGEVQHKARAETRELVACSVASVRMRHRDERNQRRVRSRPLNRMACEARPLRPIPNRRAGFSARGLAR